MFKITFIIVFLLFASGLFNMSDAQSRIRKGPYLIYSGVNSKMVVLWQLDTSLNCSLIWGTDTSYLDGSLLTTEIDTSPAGHQHIDTITGLTPGTKYYYKMTENSVPHYGSFVSAPDDTETCFGFYAYGDTRTYPAKHDSLLNCLMDTVLFSENNQSILIHSGDWISAEGESYWNSEYFNRSYSNILECQANIPINGARGNHEGTALTFMKYWPYDSLGNFYYSFDYGQAHFTIVDQYVNYSDTSAQYNWIVSDLSSSSKLWKFIVMHEPGYSDVSAHPNNVAVQTYIQPLCLAYGVQAVIYGHNHLYAHCLVSGIHHITTGGGGGPLYNVSGTGEGLIYSETTLHFLKFDICDDVCNIQTIRPNGTLADSFQILSNISDNDSTKGNIPAFRIYPNPAGNEVSIEISGINRVLMDVFNQEGKKVFSDQVIADKVYLLNTSGYSKGIYTIKISSGNFSASEKLVIR